MYLRKYIIYKICLYVCMQAYIYSQPDTHTHTPGTVSFSDKPPEDREMKIMNS